MDADSCRRRDSRRRLSRADGVVAFASLVVLRLRDDVPPVRRRLAVLLRAGSLRAARRRGSVHEKTERIFHKVMSPG